MEEAKKIVSHFIRKHPSEIDEDTKMDNSVIASSILIHRMYAALFEKGYYCTNPSSIKTFGEFMHEVTTDKLEYVDKSHDKKMKGTILSTVTSDFPTSTLSVGIDIEEKQQFQPVGNRADKSFLEETFSRKEIEYCENKSNPAESFGSLFTLKEAIIKADNKFKYLSFKDIEIEHDENGKPTFKNFILSSSHSKEYVMSIAILQGDMPFKTKPVKIVWSKFISTSNLILLTAICIMILNLILLNKLL